MLLFGVSSSRSQGFGAFTAARTEAWPGSGRWFGGLYPMKRWVLALGLFLM